MNELQVNVKQTPGVIVWNFEELKTALTAQMEEYKNTVYTEESISDASKDLAKLRKLRTAVNDRKIEIKKKCLEPFAPIDEQAKELMKLIDEPIALISTNVSTYENKRKEQRRTSIVKQMKETFSDFPEAVAKKLMQITYDSRWENKTAKPHDWSDSIQKAHDDTKSALQIIENVDPDFKDEVMKKYLQDLSVTDALRHAQYLQHQKEVVLERERQLRETELRRAEEERRLQEERERQKNEEQAPTSKQEPDPKEKEVEQILKEEKEKTRVHVNEMMTAQPDMKYPGRTILFHGTDEQLKKVLGYIKYLGAEYELRQ